MAGRWPTPGAPVALHSGVTAQAMDAQRGQPFHVIEKFASSGGFRWPAAMPSRRPDQRGHDGGTMPTAGVCWWVVRRQPWGPSARQLHVCWQLHHDAFTNQLPRSVTPK